MALFQTLQKMLGLTPLKVMDHPYFGKITFFDAEKPYWEGSKKFDLPIGMIEIFIGADEAGPSENHIKFCKDFEQNISTTVESMRPLLEKEFEVWTGQKIPENFWSEFTCSGIAIPRDGNIKNNWDISFESRTEGEHLFTVYFENGSPTRITVDG